MPERRHPFVGMLVDFARELRAAGLAVGSGDVLTYCAAMAALDPTDLLDLYWAGRTTLVTRRDQIPIYDRVFRRFFLGEAAPAGRAAAAQAARPSRDARRCCRCPRPSPDAAASASEEAELGLMASDAETLRHKSFAACTPEELAALRRIMTRIRLTPPRRRTRRTVPARRGPHARPAPDGARDACACTASRPSCSGGGASSGCGR